MYEARQNKKKMSRTIDVGRVKMETFKKHLIQKTPHRESTYEVEVQHDNANGGNSVFYYRDNVLGHTVQRNVIAAAVNAFIASFGPLSGAPYRNGRSVRTARNGAIAV